MELQGTARNMGGIAEGRQINGGQASGNRLSRNDLQNCPLLTSLMTSINDSSDAASPGGSLLSLLFSLVIQKKGGH